MKRLIIPIALTAILLTGCSKALEPFKDARVSGRDSGPAEVVNMPDGFSNVADKCNHGNRIYVAFKGNSNRAAISVVPHDPTCK